VEADRVGITEVVLKDTPETGDIDMALVQFNEIRRAIKAALSEWTLTTRDTRPNINGRTGNISAKFKIGMLAKFTFSAIP
jgi:hypothetical protein